MHKTHSLLKEESDIFGNSLVKREKQGILFSYYFSKLKAFNSHCHTPIGDRYQIRDKTTTILSVLCPCMCMCSLKGYLGIRYQVIGSSAAACRCIFKCLLVVSQNKLCPNSPKQTLISGGVSLFACTNQNIYQNDEQFLI